MNQELIMILDFGGQYNQLIARRVREHHVYCEVVPWNKPIEEIKSKNPKGIIFTGGPNSVYGENAPKCSEEIFQFFVFALDISKVIFGLRRDPGGSSPPRTPSQA